MTHVLRTSRLIGFFTFVLGLMAFGATAAQAEPGAFWKVNGAAVTDALNVELQAKLEGKHLILLTKVGVSKVEILCTSIKFVDMLMKILGRILGKIHYDGCHTYLNGFMAAACVPHSAGAPPLLIETNYLEGLIKLHQVSSGSKVDLVELKADKVVYVTIVLGSEGESECAIGEKFDITGVLFLKDCQSELLVEKKEHLFEEGPLSALKFGSNPATSDGSFNVFLVGPHVGMTWSGIAN